MSARTRQLAGTVVTLMAIVVAGTALAWACSPTASITLSSGGADQGGQSVTISGSAFVANEAPNGVPVEIRWNTADGILLGEQRANNQGAFTLGVTIPADAQRDTHQVVAVAFNDDKTEILRVTTASYVVGPPPSSPQQPTRGETSGETSGAEAPARRDTQRTNATANGGEGDLREPRRSRTTTGGRVNLVQAPRTAPTRPLPAAPVPRRETAPATPAAAPSAVSSSAVTPVSRERSRTAERRAPVAPSTRSAAADLWSGFAASGAGSARAGLRATPAAVAVTGRSPLTAALAIVGLGLMALFAGFAVVETRRRRVGAKHEDR